MFGGENGPVPAGYKGRVYGDDSALGGGGGESGSGRRGGGTGPVLVDGFL